MNNNSSINNDAPRLNTRLTEGQSSPSLQTRLQEASSALPNLQPSTHAANAYGSLKRTSPDTQAWTTAFNTSILTSRANSPDRSNELAELMQSPEYQCLLNAAQMLSNQEGCSKEVATERLISVFRRLDECWNQVILKRGMNTLLPKSLK